MNTCIMHSDTFSYCNVNIILAHSTSLTCVQPDGGKTTESSEEEEDGEVDIDSYFAPASVDKTKSATSSTFKTSGISRQVTYYQHV